MPVVTKQLSGMHAQQCYGEMERPRFSIVIDRRLVLRGETHFFENY